MKKGIKVLSLSLLSLLLTGCVSMLNFRTKVDIDPADPDVKISHYKDGRYQAIPPSNYVDYKLKNFEMGGSANIFSSKYEGQLFLIEKDGCFSENVIIRPRKVNPFKLADLGLGVGLIAGAYATTEYVISELIAIGGLFTLGSIPLGGYWKIYGSKHSMPELKPYPINPEGAPKLRLGTVNISLEVGKLIGCKYNNWKSYLKDKPYYTKHSKEKILVEESFYREEVKNQLAQTGFVDTTTKLFSTRFVNTEVSAQLVSAKTSLVNSLIQVGGDVKWTMTSQVTGQKIAEYTLFSESVLYEANPSEEKAIGQGIANVMQKTLYDFLAKPTVQSHLNDSNLTLSRIMENWDTIYIRQNPDPTMTMAGEALQSVVTILDENGHGSGVVIGTDGYIVTSHHVIEAASFSDEGEIKVQFNNGQEWKAEVVRSNPDFDLALIKIDADSLFTLSPLGLNKIKLGEPVFAIGTPNSVDLGQTLSKGIISGKRVDLERVTIQTDVSINRGNSGGALVYEDGSLLGIVNAKLFGYSVEGIGFAIPANYIQDALKIKLD